jgi:hypothetical protein
LSASAHTDPYLRAITIHWFLIQILHDNTAPSHLPDLCSRSFTVSAYG